MMYTNISASSKQRGLSMLIALIALLILSLTAVALVRSVDTGTLIIGNFSFKQDATESASTGAEQAMVWLEANQASLDNDDASRGYYASSLDKLDPTGNNTSATNKLALIDWDGLGTCSTVKSGTYENCALQPYPTDANTASTTVNGNKVQWVITRLCVSPGPASGNNCLSPGAVSSASANDRGELSAGGRISSVVNGPYYRVIVRSAGPRNTVSFTETIVHF